MLALMLRHDERDVAAIMVHNNSMHWLLPSCLHYSTPSWMSPLVVSQLHMCMHYIHLADVFPQKQLTVQVQYTVITLGAPWEFNRVTLLKLS